MMYRSIDADTWGDPWFSELSPPAKLVFLYLITNHHVTAAGTCEITLRLMAFETGLDREQLERLLPKLSPRVLWWPEHNTLWVRNFYRRQKANTNATNFEKAASRVAADVPGEVRAAIIEEYPELTVPAPPPPPKGKASLTDASGHPGMDTDASPNLQHASPSHTNGAPMPSPSHTHPIRNRNSTDQEQKQEQKQDSGEAAPADADGATAPPTPTRPPRMSTKRPKTPIPDPFEVTPAMAQWALKGGMTMNFIRDSTEYFVRWAEMHDHRYVDWRAAWENVLRSRWQEEQSKVVPFRRAQ